MKPRDYIHSYAFLELAELINFSLRELGFESTLNFNHIDTSAKNIILGCHLLDLSWLSQFPKNSVILNTEQIHSDSNDWSTNIFSWASKLEIWDYSSRNIEKFYELGIENVKHLKIGFQKELVRIDESPAQDIDVLFYGSVNERRRQILIKLVEAGLKVRVMSATYGSERDHWIARSKVVLNLHFYQSQIFEIVRVFYLLTNSIAVIGEVNETTSIDSIYKNGIYAATYNELVVACELICSDDRLRNSLKSRALSTISKYPQQKFTKEIVGSLT